jgi:hypothetical protein
MALPQGLYTPAGAGVAAPGGAYSYLAGTNLTQYFAGVFLIDTGYDDPGSWTAGLEAAEIYGARVYGASGVHNPALGAGVYAGKWMINAVPVWSSKFWETPHGNTIGQQRVLIKCEVWVAEPAQKTDGSYMRLDTVDWTLYRL